MGCIIQLVCLPMKKCCRMQLLHACGHNRLSSRTSDQACKAETRGLRITSAGHGDHLRNYFLERLLSPAWGERTFMRAIWRGSSSSACAASTQVATASGSECTMLRRPSSALAFCWSNSSRASYSSAPAWQHLVWHHRIREHMR